FLSENPSKKATILTAKLMLNEMHSAASMSLPSEEERTADFARFMERANSPVKVSSRRTWLRAAILTGVIAAASLIAFYLNGTDNISYATANGEQKEVLLADGTLVRLNANSSLQLPSGSLRGDERVVELVGEAFFAVQPQKESGKSTPFIVQTNGMDVHVLGTRFNVKERGQTTSVFLEEGSVTIEWEDDQLTNLLLSPGDLVQYTPEAQVPVQKSRTTGENELAWTSGRLVFDQEPLSKVFAELNALYGIQFHTQTPKLKEKLVSSAGIPINDLPLAIRLLEKAMNLDIEVVDDNNYLVRSAE
ncbi:MAG: FecR domain-containing protein, partial [Bacteroidota bacterium]